MRRVSSSFTIALVAVAAPPLSAAATAQAGPQVVAHTVDMSRRQATLGLELANGNKVKISLGRGVLRVNDKSVGRYAPGGPLEQAWRSLLDDAASLPTSGLKTRMAAWKVPGLAGPDLAAKRQVDAALTKLPGIGPDSPRVAQADSDTPDPNPDLTGLGDQISNQVASQVASAVAAAAQSRQARGELNVSPASRGVGSVSNNVAGLFGMFVALACIAFGLVSFAPRQLEAVTDTIQRSFVRSFFAGLFAQPLLLPVLGMMTVGLILTIVGIIVVPVALIAFALAVALGFVGGYVALARAFGEILLRRRAADGDVSVGTGPYRASVVGLAGLLAIWLPFALMSWVPAVGWVLLWCAIVFTWIMATAGFGATILSRGGIRRSFVRPELPGFTGEFGWTGEVAVARSSMKGT